MTDERRRVHPLLGRPLTDRELLATGRRTPVPEDLTERDAVRVADAHRERADRLERGDEVTGHGDASPEARAIAGLARTVASLQEQLARRTSLPPPPPDRSSDAEFGRSLRRGLAAWKVLVVVVPSVVGLLGWLEYRVGVIARGVYDDPLARAERRKDAGEVVQNRLAPLQVTIDGIDYRTKRIEGKLDQLRGSP